MKILVCGSREYTDKKFSVVCNTLDPYFDMFGDDLCIIQGGSRGADYLAKCWAEAHAVCCIEVSALWGELGKAAGPIRNSWMLKFCNPDLVIAFPGGKGTADMISRAKKANVTVIQIEE